MLQRSMATRMVHFLMYGGNSQALLGVGWGGGGGQEQRQHVDGLLDTGRMAVGTSYKTESVWILFVFFI